MRKIFILFVTFLFSIYSDLYSQGVKFSQIYGGLLEFQIFSLTETPDGGYLLAGGMSMLNGSDYKIVKTDSLGNVQWVNSGNRYDGVNYENKIFSVIFLDNYYYLTGMIVPNASQFNSKSYFVKCDTLGNIIWDKIDSSLSSNCTRVVKSGDGNLLFTGYVADTTLGIQYHSWYGKMDTSGSYLWTAVIPDTNLINASDIIELNNRFIVSSNVYKDTGSTIIYGSVLNCVDNLGNVYWNYSEKDTSKNGISKLLLDSGFIYVGQFYRTNFYAPNNYYSSIIKLDTSGNFIWRNNFSNLQSRGRGASVYVTKTNDNNLFAVCQGLDIVKLSKNGGDIWNIGQDTIFYQTQQSILNSKGNLVTTGYFDMSGMLQVPFLIEYFDTTLTNINSIQDEIKLNIFPNPFTTGIYIHSDFHGNRSVKFFSILGSILSNFDIKYGLNYINLSDLSRGIYFLSVVNNQQAKIYKIIKN